MSAIIASRQLNMSLQTQDEFIKWLDSLEEKKGWTDYRLSVETGLSSSVFSKARQGILPKWEALVRIANSLGVSPVTAFRKAGLLPPGPDDKINFEDWQHMLEKMTNAERDELFRFGQMKIDIRQENEQAARAKNFKPGKAKK